LKHLYISSFLGFSMSVIFSSLTNSFFFITLTFFISSVFFVTDFMVLFGRSSKVFSTEASPGLTFDSSSKISPLNSQTLIPIMP